MNGPASITQRTRRLSSPCRSDARTIPAISRRTDVRGAGVKPMSRIDRHATTNVASSNNARTTYGVPRFVSCASTPPPIEPPIIAIPLATCPFANAASSDPSYPVACSPSTSQASVAPLKNVNPRPSSIDTTAQSTNGASVRHSTT